MIRAGRIHYAEEQRETPRFSFTVPSTAAGQVAFHLAKAGLKDFDVTHFDVTDLSLFEFTSEPEMHVAEEIVKQEYAHQIAARKGGWAIWAPRPGAPSIAETVNKPTTQKHYVSHVTAAWEARKQGKFAGQWGERSWDSQAVHDFLDQYRDGDSPDSPVSNYDKLLDCLDALDDLPSTPQDNEVYLGVVVFLITHGSNVPAVYKQRAREIASAFDNDEAYIEEWASPPERHVELENEMAILAGEGVHTSAFDTPTLSPEAEAKQIHYRRAKLVAWIAELGLDLDDELKRFDEGDFWLKDEVYEEVREMIREERKHQNHYRRTMRMG